MQKKCPDLRSRNTLIIVDVLYHWGAEYPDLLCHEIPPLVLSSRKRLLLPLVWKNYLCWTFIHRRLRNFYTFYEVPFHLSDFLPQCRARSPDAPGLTWVEWADWKSTAQVHALNEESLSFGGVEKHHRLFLRPLKTNERVIKKLPAPPSNIVRNIWKTRTCWKIPWLGTQQAIGDGWYLRQHPPQTETLPSIISNNQNNIMKVFGSGDHRHVHPDYDFRPMGWISK